MSVRMYINDISALIVFVNDSSDNTCRANLPWALMKCTFQGWGAVVLFVFLGRFCTPSHHPSLERMPKPQRCGGGPKALIFINIYYSSLHLLLDLSRFAICEALAEEIMVVGGKLAGVQLHWLALKAPTPELPWPLVQTLLQQQRVTTHVQTSIQNESLLLDTSTGSRDTFQQRYVKLQKHHSPLLSERSSSRTDRSLGVPDTRVFVSTLPKTKGEVGLRLSLCTVCLTSAWPSYTRSPFQAEAREAAAMRPLSRSQHDGHPLAPVVGLGSSFKRTATGKQGAGHKTPVFV
jgi:hypothetical protein